jgi:hypothetical protein
MQKKKPSELSDYDNELLSHLYGQISNEFETDISTRSDIMKKMVTMDEFSKKLSITTFARLSDLRIKLMRLKATVEKLENYEKYEGDVEMLLCQVRTIMVDPKLTDVQIFDQINHLVKFSKLKFDNTVKELFKCILAVLTELIINEKEHGLYTEEKEPQPVRELDTAKKVSVKKHSRHKSKQHSSTQAIEEASAAKTEKDATVIERIDKKSDKETDRQAPDLQLKELPEQLPPPALPLAPEMSAVVVPALPAIEVGEQPAKPGTTLLLIKKLSEQAFSPRSDDSAPSSVHTELGELKTARSMSTARSAYEELVRRNSSLLPQQATISPRFTLRDAHHRGLRSGSVSARFEVASKEAALSEGSATVRVKGSK